MIIESKKVAFNKSFFHFFLFLLGQASFPRTFRPTVYAANCLSFEEVMKCACHKVLVEVDDNSLLIVGDPQGILGKQLRPSPIH